jgi:transcriptional regulator with XRE-family HTH domain
MATRSELGTFLSARRAQLVPDEVGLGTYGERRRVPGLRREELAMLAGVSVSYYTRLEQGQSAHASPEVLDALARALQLDADEHQHLLRLGSATTRGATPRRPAPERLTEAEQELFATFTDVPVVVAGRSFDVLAWNGLGHALLAGHVDPAGPDRPADRPNLIKLIFLDAHSRELYVDWRTKAAAVVTNLRAAVGQRPDDPKLASLIGELTMKSPDFATMWSRHRVKPCTVATYELRHPVVGALTVTQQALNFAQSDGHVFIAMTTTPGSASAASLALLGQASLAHKESVGPSQTLS